MEKFLSKIPFTVDDILVTGKNDQDHLQYFNLVFQVLLEAGLWLKLSKRKFLQTSVVYLGMEISEEGMRHVEEQIQAIRGSMCSTECFRIEVFFRFVKLLSKVHSKCI